MYRLKVKSKRRWITGKVIYQSLQEAQIRSLELKSIGIISKVITDLGEDVVK